MNYKTQTFLNSKVVWYEANGYRISFMDPSPGNSEYDAYLAWLAAGNEPEVIEG